MKENHIPLAFLAVVLLVPPGVVRAADYHHVHITASAPAEAVNWYTRYMDCQPVADRRDAANCDGVELVFVVQPTMGSTQGTGVNHIGCSYADLTAKMAELEAVGVRGSGVRLQRFPDGATLRDVPGLFKIGFIFDPWGTRIELVEDLDYLGFHHVHLSATDPAATLAFYRDVLGGEPASLRGRLDGLLFDDVWFSDFRAPGGDAGDDGGPRDRPHRVCGAGSRRGGRGDAATGRGFPGGAGGTGERAHVSQAGVSGGPGQCEAGGGGDGLCGGRDRARGGGDGCDGSVRHAADAVGRAGLARGVDGEFGAWDSAGTGPGRGRG